METEQFVKELSKIKSYIKEQYDLTEKLSFETNGITAMYVVNDLYLMIYINDKLEISAFIYNKDKIIDYSDKSYSVENVIKNYSDLINSPDKE